MVDSEAIEVDGQSFTWGDILAGLVERIDIVYRPQMAFNVRWNGADGDPELCCESNFEILVLGLWGAMAARRGRPSVAAAAEGWRHPLVAML